jgi:hypothetical protein
MHSRVGQVKWKSCARRVSTPELLDVAGMSRAFFGTPAVSCSPTPSRSEDL